MFSSDLSSSITNILYEYAHLFHSPTSLPPPRTIFRKVYLFPNTKPVNVRLYHYPHFRKSEMKWFVQEMLKQRIIRPRYSPFSSPILLVKKKDGSYHFCVDYRALNAVTVQDKFLILTINEPLDELWGACIISKLDFRAGYRLSDRDIYKTAFRPHARHFEFLVLPFGMSNGPATFQTNMNRLFVFYLHKFVINFLMIF